MPGRACLIERCGFPKKIFPKLVAPGTILGPLLPEVAAETGLDNSKWWPLVRTILEPRWRRFRRMSKEDWAYLSSGTWSLLGVELPGPLINEKVRELNFTNEAGLRRHDAFS